MNSKGFSFTTISCFGMINIIGDESHIMQMQVYCFSSQIS